MLVAQLLRWYNQSSLRRRTQILITTPEIEMRIRRKLAGRDTLTADEHLSIVTIIASICILLVRDHNQPHDLLTRLGAPLPRARPMDGNLRVYNKLIRARLMALVHCMINECLEPDQAAGQAGQ
jgi:hypothetical protein